MKKKGLSALFQPVELTQGECWKTILAFSFPIIVSYLLQQVYTISDAAIVGQTLTAQEVAGVNDSASAPVFAWSHRAMSARIIPLACGAR